VFCVRECFEIPPYFCSSSKNATATLKNGDLVEVDADHGLVRIIN
jgi:phosphohistidine swiveling domain-containing protein